MKKFINRPYTSVDVVLNKIIEILKKKYKCHTAILYGSRAKGTATASSDYDVVGIRKTGKKIRIARKFKKTYMDLFVYPENDFRKINDLHLFMRKGIVLFEKNKFGSNFLVKLQTFLKRNPEALPADEIAALKIWPFKMLERAKRGDVEGNYRKVWLTTALLEDYFHIRKLRYLGPKDSLQWLADRDPLTYKLFEKVLLEPKNLALLEKLVKRVVRRKK